MARAEADRVVRAGRRRVPRGPALLLIGAAALAAASCGRAAPPDPPVRVTMRVSPDPPRVGAAEIELRVADDAGSPLHGAALSLEGTMTHPGMTPRFAEAHETEPGVYRARLELTMAGDWIVVVTGQLAEGTAFERTLDLPGVRPR